MQPRSKPVLLLWPLTQLTPWCQRRARLVAAERGGDGPSTVATAERWAHALPSLETVCSPLASCDTTSAQSHPHSYVVRQGCLLIANPTLFSTSQTYFNKAVIFVYSHSSEGSAGLILNRSTDKRLRDVTNSPQFDAFSENVLWLGGDVGRTTIHLMHPEHIGGTRIVPGIGMGAFDEARKAVRAGIVRPEDCRFFTRYAGWGPGQLAEEVNGGVWFLAAASASVILEGRAQAQTQTWADVLHLMGGEYSQMADAALREQE